jgi:hypothetical protein
LALPLYRRTISCLTRGIGATDNTRSVTSVTFTSLLSSTIF